MYRICFVFFFFLFSLPLSFSLAEGFRENVDVVMGEEVKTLIVRNRAGWRGGRTVVRINCLDESVHSETDARFRLSIRKNGDAFRSVQLVTLRVDDNPVEVFEAFVKKDHEDSDGYLLSRGERGLVLQDIDARNLGAVDIDFTQVTGWFADDDENQYPLDRIFKQMKTGKELYVEVLANNTKKHTMDFTLTGALNYYIPTLCPSSNN